MTRGRSPRIPRLPEELAFLARTGAYGLGIAVVYWLVTDDVTGTVLLGMFGVATSVAFVLLVRGVWRAPVRDSDRPFVDESGAVPLQSLAPLWLGAGIALLGLGLVYGLWFFIAAAFPLTVGASGWLSEVATELRMVAEDDEP